LKPEQLAELVRYRMDQAYETLREAEILLGESALRGAVNRAYYAMFYALLDLLATKQFPRAGNGRCSRRLWPGGGGRRWKRSGRSRGVF
jgi:hypothetical protein